MTCLLEVGASQLGLMRLQHLSGVFWAPFALCLASLAGQPRGTFALRVSEEPGCLGSCPQQLIRSSSNLRFYRRVWRQLCPAVTHAAVPCWH